MEPEGSLPHSQVPATCPYLSHTNPVHAPTSQSWRFVLILISHLFSGLPSGLFPPSFPTKTLYTQLLSPICATCPAHLFRLDLIIWTVLGEEYKSLSSSLCGFLYSPYLIPRRPKSSPQHVILKTPQPTFLYQCKRPSFAHTQNNRQHFITVYLNLCIFRNQCGRPKILHRMIASIPWIHWFLSEQNFDSLKLFPNIWTLSPTQKKYYQSLYCDFDLHPDLETWPCT